MNVRMTYIDTVREHNKHTEKEYSYEGTVDIATLKGQVRLTSDGVHIMFTNRAIGRAMKKALEDLKEQV